MSVKSVLLLGVQTIMQIERILLVCGITAIALNCGVVTLSYMHLSQITLCLIFFIWRTFSLSQSNIKPVHTNSLYTVDIALKLN